MLKRLASLDDVQRVLPFSKYNNFPLIFQPEWIWNEREWTTTRSNGPIIS